MKITFGNINKLSGTRQPIFAIYIYPMLFIISIGKEKKS